MLSICTADFLGSTSSPGVAIVVPSAPYTELPTVLCVDNLTKIASAVLLSDFDFRPIFSFFMFQSHVTVPPSYLALVHMVAFRDV